MKILNLTPHPVHVIDKKGEVVRTFPASGKVARLEVETERTGVIDGIPTVRTKFGDPEGLPAPTGGTFYIVSQLIKSALPYRADLLVPADVVRDSEGRVIGCRAFQV